MSHDQLTIDNEQLPEGYQQTELGVIPETWNVISIQTALDEKYLEDQMDGNHGELYPRSHEFVSYGIPYVGANDFWGGRVSFKNCKFLSEARAKKFRKGIAHSGDVLFAHNATVGPVALLDFDGDFLILSTTATYFRCNKEKLSNLYFRFVLEAQYFVKQYRAVMAQSTRFQVPITIQRKFLIAIPRLEEQRSIAQALSDVDRLIAALEKAIGKKRAIKTATMQQLLTGKKRLPGFGEGKGDRQTEVGLIPEDWTVKKIGEEALTYSGGTPSTNNSEYYSGNISWITSGDLNKQYISEVNGKISEKGLKNSSAKMIPANTLLIALYGATAGVSAISEIEAAINQAVLAIIPKELDKSYLFYILQLTKEQIIETYTQGGQPNLSGEIIRSLPIAAPKLEEQREIATVLSDMDTAIAAIETRLAKTQSIKQGMMQELLTGRTRLV